MEMMYNRTGKQFALITTEEVILLNKVKNFQDVPTMVTEVGIPLDEPFMKCDYSTAFPQPDLALGRWFGLPNHPHVPQMIYMTQQDGSVDLYSFGEKRKCMGMLQGMTVMANEGFEVYYKMKAGV